MKNKIFIVFIFIFLTYSYGQEEKQIDYFELSLEELLNINVITASKNEESISQAAAVIDVITKKHIEELNVNNLYELISMVPGIELIETFWGRTTLNFRGITNQHYNNKVLMLINGTSVYEPVLGSYLLEQVPINAIERIEIIRGPGSALYGSNAYSGIINIITKKGDEENKIDFDLSYGSFNTYSLGVSYSKVFNENTNLFVSANYSNTDGYPFEIKKDEKNNSGSLNYKNKPISIFANFNYGNLSLDFSFLDIKKDHYGIVPVITFNGQHHWQRFYINPKYFMPINDSSNIQFSLKHYRYNNPKTTLGYGFAGFEDKKAYNQVNAEVHSGEVQFNLKLANGIQNLSGLSYEHFISDPYNFFWEEDNSLNHLTAFRNSHTGDQLSFYTQINYTKLDKLNLLAGFRIVKDYDVGKPFFLPRVAIVYEIFDDFSTKFLYGEAFRSASFFEKYVDTYNILYGSQALLPEKIQTIDFALEYNLPNQMKTRLNAYYIETKNGLDRKPSMNPAEQGPNALIYVNATKYKYYGLEFLIEGYINSLHNFMLNFAYKVGENKLDNIDLYGFAPFTVNGFFNYKTNNFSITPSFQYIGDRKGKSIREGEYKLDSYLIANLALNYKIDNLKISLNFKNLLNQKYSYPEFIRGLSEEVPGGPAFNYCLAVTIGF